MRFLVVGAAILIAFPALAQQPQAAKDRKDFLIEAIAHQGDTARMDAASCYADANLQIAKLQGDNAKLKAEIDALKAPPKAEPAPEPK